MIMVDEGHFFSSLKREPGGRTRLSRFNFKKVPNLV